MGTYQYVEFLRQTGYFDAIQTSEGKRTAQISRVCGRCDRSKKDSSNHCPPQGRKERFICEGCIGAIKNGVPGTMTLLGFTPDKPRS